MLVAFPPIFVADAKNIYGFNFAAPLRPLGFTFPAYTVQQ